MDKLSMCLSLFGIVFILYQVFRHQSGDELTCCDCGCGQVMPQSEMIAVPVKNARTEYVTPTCYQDIYGDSL